jgi:hypothetical protein
MSKESIGTEESEGDDDFFDEVFDADESKYKAECKEPDFFV